MTRGLYWLASYPKSGNTWMRALLTYALSDDDTPPDINRLDGASLVNQRAAFDQWSGMKSADLSGREIDWLRPAFCASLREMPRGSLFSKVHNACTRTADGALVFPREVTAGVVCIVRNPLDVAHSYAHHDGVDIDVAVARMADPEHTLASQREVRGTQLPQRLLTWSENVASWLDSGHRVLLVRYEDMLVDTVGQLARVVEFFARDVDAARLARAVALARFERLQEQESRHGFVERSRRAPVFFREGRAGGWKGRLTPAQVARIVADHGPMMRRLGYALPSFDPAGGKLADGGGVW